MHHLSPPSHHRLLRALSDDAGAATAEYAIATLAAVGLAGLLVVILRGDDVKGMLTELIHRALTTQG
jgi:Flp pilus assembly pilin Flp